VRRSRGLDNVFQRGVIGVLSAVGGLLVGFLAWPVHRLLGLPGLVGWMAAGVALATAGSRWAMKGEGA